MAHLDASTIAVAVKSLKDAADIAKVLVGLRDAAQIKTKVIDLQSAILTAQSDALSAQHEQMVLLQQVRELQAEVAGLKQQLSSRGNLPEALICPMCRNELRVTAEHDDSTFAFAGVKVHSVACAKCSYTGDRRYRPGKGYS